MIEPPETDRRWINLEQCQLPLPLDPTADVLLDGFTEWVSQRGLELYPAQEDAVLALLSGNHVVITTPTGSGKSLVATAAHYDALARGQRSVYTAPIKALVSEKFFDLREIFGSDNVGMVTGDSQINPAAPILCCTAEILAHAVLQSGSTLPVAHVTMDEFHFFADRDRGWAWEVPLLECIDARFLLMSATLGDTSWLETHLDSTTAREVSLVAGGPRPVPLDFHYSEVPLHESIAELLETKRAPIYVVYFTQRAATEAAQAFLSLDVLTKEEKAQAAELMRGFRFDTPFGKDLRKFLASGIGVHHAGLLPRYRMLVERLAREGLLKLICGTDTLGVGVNIPIRTVLLTQLCKFDGSKMRGLSVREFQQIAGRAGRRGYDTEGTVWAQAPAHWVENRRAEAKAATAGKRVKNKKKPPERGFKDWNADTFDRLVHGVPETLISRFDVNHGMVLHLLGRPGDGRKWIRSLIEASFTTERSKELLHTKSHDIIESLLEAEILQALEMPDSEGRELRVHESLQERFSLDRPLSPFVVDMLMAFSTEGDSADQEAASIDLAARPNPYAMAFDMLSVIEASLEDPMALVLAQRDKIRDELWNRLKSEGVEFEERQNQVAEVDWPQPLAEELKAAWQIHLEVNPWLAGEWVRPKSIARDLYEQGDTFSGYVQHLGAKRSEGLLLRYLTDCYRALNNNVPEDLRTEELAEITEWLGEVVRSVDPSLIDEWERMERVRAGQAVEEADADSLLDGAPRDVTRNRRAFRAMIRTEMFRWVQALARRDYVVLEEQRRSAVEPDSREGATVEASEAVPLAELMAPFWAEHGWIGIDANARSGEFFLLDEPPPGGTPTGFWPVTQTLLDPEGTGEWRLRGLVDIEASRLESRAVIRFESLEGASALGE